MNRGIEVVRRDIDLACRQKIKGVLGYLPEILVTRFYQFTRNVSTKEMILFGENVLSSPVAGIHLLTDHPAPEEFSYYIVIARRKGVTDDEGAIARGLFTELFPHHRQQHQFIFVRTVIYFKEPLSAEEVQRVIQDGFGERVIDQFYYGAYQGKLAEMNFGDGSGHGDVKRFILGDDQQLENLSQKRLLALDLNEMQTIRHHFLQEDVQKQRRGIGLDQKITDCELEIIAQTWSEHCKHKIFQGEILFYQDDQENPTVIDSLFNTYVRKATETVQKALERRGDHWIIKVFDDNAGIVSFDDQRYFLLKVETHNSPSAIDPYGGAITGILGNNRDPMGTGIGGGRLIFNTNVLCFGFPDSQLKLLPGQLHPKTIFKGVRKGIEDGGNKMGIPTINGAILFEHGYRGKPLVYCGTGALMDRIYSDRETAHKTVTSGDLIVMAGGRVGKDGIHGATFSSLAFTEQSPSSAVQIGSPFTQKRLFDLMQVAAKRGLIKSSTDNGAGGLSSSVGELATISNGAEIHLDQVPLKYEGLTPWEILLSESQERMTFVIDPENIKPLLKLAQHMDVECSMIGTFNSSGFLNICYQRKMIASLSLDFLHNGLPRKKLTGRWKTVPQIPYIPELNDLSVVLLSLLKSWNICSRASIVRQYDHEVQGQTIIKPLMGRRGGPQDCGVVRVDFDSFEGIAVTSGICPKYGHIDPYQMSAGAFDEGIRQIIAVGGKLPGHKDAGFWSVNDNFCMPDPIYHATDNPDGERKMGQLVLMNQALYDMAIYFNIPLTSGKDSMKNDLKLWGEKISIPPTILYTVAAKIKDIRQLVTAGFKQSGDLIYLVGHTYQELGGSELARLLHHSGGVVPEVRKEVAETVYQKMMRLHDHHLIKSAHDLSDGGLGTTLAEECFSYFLGGEIILPETVLTPEVFLFSESHSRFVVSISPNDQKRVEEIMGDEAVLLGVVTQDPVLRVLSGERRVINLSVTQMFSHWSATMERLWDQ